MKLRYWFQEQMIVCSFRKLVTHVFCNTVLRNFYQLNTCLTGESSPWLHYQPCKNSLTYPNNISKIITVQELRNLITYPRPSNCLEVFIFQSIPIPNILSVSRLVHLTLITVYTFLVLCEFYLHYSGFNIGDRTEVESGLYPLTNINTFIISVNRINIRLY